MNHVFPPAASASVPVTGSAQRFPVHRIYCVGRNYAEHAREMGASGREAPFFFMKPADAVLPAPADASAAMPYPPQTADLHHEVELVLALGRGGSDIAPEDAAAHIWGYAVGLDMTRRDLQAQAKKLGRPWCTAKGFDASAPIGAITPAARAGDIDDAEITLSVNGALRQSGRIAQMIWNCAEVISHLSRLWTLQPGDLVFTGTPAGVAAVARGDRLRAEVTGLEALSIEIV
ncbi:fumarylacetoacetate hydrolase family protein [Comamonas sp. NLF-1-9]|uniref:fumarylacetoacetate hydrolase family protein n=1 Tax=Comamonas sp. NLF-1-9 TaxID=2853163 RepID=UPI001C494151|nr:fumarylacetoacetate hydrolase family protein [Comamonas sp. NLF-1-9]QXL85364.1 fumarylacetoacetate hydrolase family protein [Comamonas sp. NLF-1-9]